MTSPASFVFLGTGASMGVPVIGCSCKVCLSDLPHNKRLRSSGLLNIFGKTILIDAGPDFRAQALREGLVHLDGFLITHTHFDHTAGIDDLRIFYLVDKKELPCLLSKASLDDIRQRYAYLFRKQLPQNNVTARFLFQPLEEERGNTSFLGIPMTYLSYTQGGMLVTGFRFGSFAYISDIKQYSETIFDDLKGVKYLVLSALRMGQSQVHFNIDEAVAFSRQVGAKKTWLTHLAHELDFDETNAYLPLDIRLAFDGLRIEFEP